jgi:hypothetical protein
LHLHRLHIHGHSKPAQEPINVPPHISNGVEGNQLFRKQTEEEVQQRELIQQYVFSKLETYQVIQN